MEMIVLVWWRKWYPFKWFKRIPCPTHLSPILNGFVKCNPFMNLDRFRPAFNGCNWRQNFKFILSNNIYMLTSDKLNSYFYNFVFFLFGDTLSNNVCNKKQHQKFVDKQSYSHAFHREGT